MYSIIIYIFYRLFSTFAVTFCNELHTRKYLLFLVIIIIIYNIFSRIVDTTQGNDVNLMQFSQAFDPEGR